MNTATMPDAIRSTGRGAVTVVPRRVESAATTSKDTGLLWYDAASIRLPSLVSQATLRSVSTRAARSESVVRY
jgi:hypothetical protein